MYVRITSDANSESGVGEVVDEISGPTRQNFVARDYGVGLLGIVIVFMCRDSELNFKRRLRFVRKEKTIYMDVMLELGQMTRLGHPQRMQVIVDRLMDEVPLIVNKYNIAEFNYYSFELDLKAWLMQFGRASNSTN